MSIYVNIDPGARHEPSQGDIALRAGLTALRERLEASGERPRLALLERRLKENAAGLAALADPSRPARDGPSSSRSRGERRTRRRPRAASRSRWCWRRPPISCRFSWPSRSPRRSGSSRSRATARGSWRSEGAGAEESLRLAFDDQSAEWRRLQGPAGGTPANQRQVSSQADLFARRVEEHRRHQLTLFGETLWERAGARGWTHVLVAGDPERTEGLRASRPEGGPHVLVSPQLLPDHLSPVAVRDATAPEIRAARLAGQLALAEHTRDAALAAAGHGAVGVGDTLEALAEGRVHHLLVDPVARPAGSRAPDGRLVPAGEVPPGAAAGQMSPSPTCSSGCWSVRSTRTPG